MKLERQWKQDSGYDWVMSRLETVSPFGGALAREPGWYGPGRERELEEELARVETVLGWDSRRIDGLTHQLSGFRDIRNSFRRAAGAPMDAVELFEVKHFLLHLERLAREYQSAPLAGVALPDLGQALSLLDPTGRRLSAFSVENAFDPALERVRADKARVERELREGQGEELMERRRELVRQEDAAELAARRRLTAALLRERDAFFAAMDGLGRLDLVLAKARLARKFGCVRPVLREEPTVTVEAMTHPQVAQRLAEAGLAFTPVSVELERGATVVTGANMGGKSVSLKAATLNLLLMHTGFFVFAAKMSSPLFHAVVLIGADGQSADRGLSSFGADVKTLDQVLRQEKGQFFFLALDEFARGTNPREGAALARALVKHLGELDCVALLSTHYDGVASAARRHYQVVGLSAADLPNASGPELLKQLPRLMDYRLLPARPDAPCPQDARKVCRLLDLEEELLRCLDRETKTKERG